jgi:hypothetical protein
MRGKALHTVTLQWQKKPHGVCTPRDAPIVIPSATQLSSETYFSRICGFASHPYEWFASTNIRWIPGTNRTRN